MGNDVSKRTDINHQDQNEEPLDQEIAATPDNVQHGVTERFPDELKNLHGFEVQVGINHRLPNPITLDPKDWLNSDYEEGRFYVQPLELFYKREVDDGEDFQTRYELIQWMERYIRMAVEDFNSVNSLKYHCVQWPSSKRSFMKPEEDE